MGALWLTAFFLFLDRVNMSLAAPTIMGELQLTGVETGFILSIYYWGYITGQLGGGIASDKFTIRTWATVMFLAWCVLTALTGACMVALGDADAMVTGATRNYSVALDDIRRVIDIKPGHRLIGCSLVLARGRNLLVADTAITEMPDAQGIAEIAIEAAGAARRLGYEPRVGMLAFSTFGHPQGERSARVIEAVKILDQRRVDFEYEGDMAADVALNPEAAAAYPFNRLTGPANVLIMPAFHSASISSKMLQELGGATVIGPMLVGLDRPVQIVQLGAKDSQLVNMAALAAYNVSG
jgi:malate dehydrogenase (oxaloacetate-decarboxylating)(NADP+)